MSRGLRWGVALVILGYGVWVYSALGSNLFVHAHPEHEAHFIQYTALWPTTLTVALAWVEMVIALTALRNGARWAWLAVLVPVVVVGIPRIATDERCLANITTQHGCHTPMIAWALIVIGLGISAGGVFRKT